jgi:hypothetical protein
VADGFVRLRAAIIRAKSYRDELDQNGKVLMTSARRRRRRTHSTPSDVLVGPNGDVFVADGMATKPTAHRKIRQTGKFLKAWGKPGAGPGEFNEPHGLWTARGR